ncbi:f-box-like domain superfamily [Holotrichia oblita]|uniref:F-box-like domain superfamily n=1 Tax=Holotrichia oblita TaxID=644536 RepID=A0ACB9SPR2_HOLOL|nr:f-box-like domain superfamily [Holotrichia oblita]
MEKTLLAQEAVDDFEDDAAEERTYMLRKRIRLSTTQSTKTKSPYVYKRPYRRKNPIMHLPTELLYKIFSFLSNEELGKTVRLVNHRFRTVAQFLLNTNFRQLLKRLEDIKAMIVDSIHHTHDDMETRCMCKMLGTLELLMFYHSIIKSTLWRYLYFQKPVSNLCMYAGSILDLYNTVLKQFVTEPHIIYSPGILRDYALSKEVKEICSSSKAFALYFDRISEMPINANPLCSGCKILDILDSATDVNRTVISQKLIGNTLTLKSSLYPGKYCV